MKLDLDAIAKDAAERVHKNGGCVPQLSFAPILFALQDALSLPAGGEDDAWLDGLREPIARVIDPWPFSIVANIQYTERAADERAKADAKADQVVALISAARKGGAHD